MRLLIAATALAAAGAPCAAQTLRGRVLDITTFEAVDLALVVLLTEAGDSLSSAVTDDDGSFSLTSPDPGSFRIRARAFGYRETSAGIFDLGPGAEMTLEVRMTAAPLRIDAIIVELDHPTVDNPLVRNGFVERYRRGIGRFITPYDIEHTTALSTEDLLAAVPGVFVRPNSGANAFLGDVVEVRGPMGPCGPTVMVDGHRSMFGRSDRFSLPSLVPLSNIAAVEIFRGPAEVPDEYNATRSPRGTICGVILIWTRLGR